MLTSKGNDLERAVGDELAPRLRLAVTRLARRMRQEADTGLSPSLVSALSLVERIGPLTPSQLAAHERIARPTATRILGNLEDAGLVERHADPDDGRVVHVQVLPEGREVLARLRLRKDAYLERGLGELEPQELDDLARALPILEGLLDLNA